jgi:hypothetical protein
MKNKIYKIMGVALVAMLLASLTVGLAAPAAADPGTLKWSKMVFPADGFNGSYFRDTGITGIGPIAKAIDGSLFAYVPGLNDIFKSTDGGRTWKETKFKAAVTGGGLTLTTVVAITPSSKDASIVYVAAQDNSATDPWKVWKSTDVFTKTKWSDIATPSLTGVLVGDITCLDVGYKSGNPFIFVGSAFIGAGSVYYINEAAYGAGWQNLDTQTPFPGLDVFSVAADPGFDGNSQIEAVVSGGGTTYVTNNTGSKSVWFGAGGVSTGTELNAGNTSPITSFGSIGASKICFPDDFDASTNYDLYVGVVSDVPAGSGAGDVYEVIPGIAYDQNVATLTGGDGIISLDLTGNAGSTMMVAGQYGASDVYYTTDNGTTWTAASRTKAPIGSATGPTLVLMADDFATSNKAWAATTSDAAFPAAFSLTTDGGKTWNGISLIDTDVAAVNNITFSGSNLRFMATSPTAGNDTLWKYDGTNWEMVYSQVTIDLTQVSPKYATDTTVFCADKTTPVIYKSTNGGASFRTMVNVPAAPINGWVVISPTILLSSDGTNIYKTKDAGRTAWSTVGTGINAISFAMSPAYDTDTTLLAGSNAGKVYKSTNAGDTWSTIDSTFGGDGNVYVAFDPLFATNSTFYAASGSVSSVLNVERYDPTNKWTDITDSTLMTAALTNGATGIACSADGTLYVTDALAVDMFRTLAPTAPSAAKCEWEQVVKNVSSGTNLDSLALTAGSNVLWGIKGAAVWTYEDTLAVPVVLVSPADKASSGRTDTASLTWTALAGADKYEFLCNTRADFYGAAQTVTSPASVNAGSVSGLSGGATYYWKVRVLAGNPIKSRWSTVWSFTTGMVEAQWNPGTGPIAAAPAPGATDVPIRPTFAWNASDFATGYEFELSKAPGTTAGGFFVDALIGMTGTNALVNTSWQCDRDLDYSTTYYWHVRAINATSQSQWLTGVFTTVAKPVPPPTPTPPVTVTQEVISPPWIWAIVIIGAILVIAVIVLIVTTRRVP